MKTKKKKAKPTLAKLRDKKVKNMRSIFGGNSGASGGWDPTSF